jgi:hypothetical protein
VGLDQRHRKNSIERSANIGMKNLLIVAILIMLPALAAAQFYDTDGHLVISWQAPATGSPLDHYIWSYTINGVVDSVQGVTAASGVRDSSVTLAQVGNWAIFKIRAVSIFSDTSVVVSSDTAYYNPGQGIGPPRGVTWQGP